MKITEQIKVSNDLTKLNDCRLKLRAIDFSELKTNKEKYLYADAYRQLALAFRNHHYSRPAYDIYQKYLSLKDTMLNDEKNKLISETLKNHADMHTSILNEIAATEKEKNLRLLDKSTLDALRKNNLRYSVIFTLAFLGIFIFIFRQYTKKLKSAKSLLHNNRQNIFEKNNAFTKGQMSLGVMDRLKFLNEDIVAELQNALVVQEVINKGLKPVKEAEQPLNNLNENISQIGRLSEISSKTIAGILKKI
ncbi:MAG: hypothetical protein ABIT08_11230 [Bacteroidia bacterium]